MSNPLISTEHCFEVMMMQKVGSKICCGSGTKSLRGNKAGAVQVSPPLREVPNAAILLKNCNGVV
jgi:hypothetical protein